ncbi:Aldo-keto reductase IolS [Thermoflexales bacterium]|nr:Aldo-keto reductase IolS [Thermoflexales bacterium]
MALKTLGNSGLQISAVGLGAWAIGGEWLFDGNPAGWGKVDDAESIRAIHAALDAGMNLIDTAANYGTGHSEQIVGQAVRDRRAKVVIATKFGFNVDEAGKRVMYQTPDDILNNLPFECERSLRNLGVDVIDLYQFHMWDFPAERVPELLDQLEQLVAQGKIRTYGWSTDNVELSQLFAKGKHAVAVQHAANVLQPAAAMFAFTAQAGLTSLIRSPLMMGFLSDKYDQDVQFVETDVRRRGFPRERVAQIVENRVKIREILTSNGRTVAQGALAWLWAQGEQVVPIPGIRTEAQARENAAAMQFGPLAAEQLAQIDQLLDRKETLTI